MVEFNKDSSGKRIPQEGLRHSPNEIIIGLTESPAGKPCIGMTFDGEDWILLISKNLIIADRLRRQLQEELNVSSLPGLPFDWRTSLAQQKLVLYKEDPSKPNKPIGIFVPADRFDDLADSSFVI